MTILLIILHVAVCITLIAFVLLQHGKGAEMGASFGASGSQSVFGASGGTTFLSKLTTAAAIIFMLTSLVLAYRSSQFGGSSVMAGKGQAQKGAPQQPATPGQAPVAPGQPAAPPQGAQPIAPTMPAQQVPAPAAPAQPAAPK